MSVENVEVVRFHFEAFNRGDIERCVAFWRDDVELVVSEALPEPGRYLGRDAAAAWFRNYFGSFEPGYTFRLEEIFDVGGDPPPQERATQRDRNQQRERVRLPRRGREDRASGVVPGPARGP
jgi:ketosteroid isomerase-like protein